MRGWIVTDEGGEWSVKLDVGDLLVFYSVYAGAAGHCPLGPNI